MSSKLMRETRQTLFTRATRMRDRAQGHIHPDLMVPVERLIRYHNPTKVMLIAAMEVLEHAGQPAQTG